MGKFSDIKGPTGAWAFPGDISPTALGANTDDWAPTGLSTASVIRASASAAYNLTGLTGGADGRMIVLANIGSYGITLKHDVTSTAANRFYTPNGVDLYLQPGSALVLIYDSTSSRWRITSLGNVLRAVESKGSVSGAQTFDLSKYGSIKITSGGNITVDLTGTYLADKVYVSELVITNGGANTWGWAAKFHFVGSTIPTLTTSGVDSFTLLTRDGGTTCMVFTNGLDVKAD